MPAPLPSSSTPAAMADLTRRVAVALLVALLILAIAYILWREVHVLLQAFAGALFALFLGTMSEWLSQHTGWTYRRALVVVVLVLFGAGGIAGWLLANRLATQAVLLEQQLPEALDRIRAALAEYPWGRALIEQIPRATDALVQLGDFSRFSGVVSGVFGFLVTGVVILFVGIFGAAEPALYRAGLLHLVPPSYRSRAEEAIDAVVFNLRWWLLGQVCLMALMAATTTVGLWIIGVPLAMTLGLIAGLLEAIPYIGPWLSAVPALLIALLISPWAMLMTAALFLVLHLLEGYIFQPWIQNRVVKLPPALTLVMQVLFGDLLGIMGLLVAAPLTVVAVVLLKMLYVEDTLGDQTARGPGER